MGPRRGGAPPGRRGPGPRDPAGRAGLGAPGPASLTGLPDASLPGPRGAPTQAWAPGQGARTGTGAPSGLGWRLLRWALPLAPSGSEESCWGPPPPRGAPAARDTAWPSARPAVLWVPGPCLGSNPGSSPQRTWWPLLTACRGSPGRWPSCTPGALPAPLPTGAEVPGSDRPEAGSHAPREGAPGPGQGRWRAGVALLALGAAGGGPASLRALPRRPPGSRGGRSR